MNSRNLILFVVIFVLFISCKSETEKSKAEYNQKANELIQQLITEENCHCVLEIPKQTTMESQALENPKYDSELYYGRKLTKQNIAEMDSLNKTKQSFELSEEFIRKNKIKIIKRDSVRILYKDINFITKTCKKGVTYFIKPNFNKNFNVAAILYGESGMCVGNNSRVFEFKNNKWKEK